MSSGARCTPPKSIAVKSHWRWVRKTRKKKRTRRVPKGNYYVATDGRRTCGHYHTSWRAAIACARRKDRTERNLRARYGRAHLLAHWYTDTRKGR